MKLIRTSEATGVEHEREIPLIGRELQEGLHAMKYGALIQDAFPTLSDDDREFILTGITPEEWDSLFPEEVEEECCAHDDEPPF